jgi:prolyl-tRNA synthetase
MSLDPIQNTIQQTNFIFKKGQRYIRTIQVTIQQTLQETSICQVTSYNILVKKSFSTQFKEILLLVLNMVKDSKCN